MAVKADSQTTKINFLHQISNNYYGAITEGLTCHQHINAQNYHMQWTQT